MFASLKEAKMFKKLLVVVLPLLLAGCHTVITPSEDTNGLKDKGTVEQNGLQLFPRSNDGDIGDVMPYFDGEYMNYFYLLNEDQQSMVGFHPWSLLRTKDYITYEDVGVVIPYEKDAGSQDLALGTGSVIKDKNGLYHAYYTGYNGTGNTPYFEKIQHATSSDLINWTKHPEHGFYGGHNDFRDPYVLYMEETNNYWMLITTRHNNVGVLKLYTSTDLITWNYDRVFFTNDAGSYNLECPTLIKFGNYWYLSYSEQGAFRVTHYRYTNNLSSGVWQKPADDYFDGVGVYAARLEKADDRLIYAGWQAVKQFDYDGGDFDWGGNLAVHELIQLSNGELRPCPMREVVEALNTEVHYEKHVNNEAMIKEDGEISFSGQSDSLLFDELLERPTRMTFSLTTHSLNGTFAMTFGGNNDSGSLNILFDFNHDRLSFYNVALADIKNAMPQAYVPLHVMTRQTLTVTVLSEGECLSLYIADQFVLSVRMYAKTNNAFGFVGEGADVTIKNIHFYE
jgi:beta-fructofuranosidase